MNRYRMFGCVGLSLVLIWLLPLWAGQDAPVLKVGDKAPMFNANDYLGNLWQSSKALKSGRFLVVYFYSAAMTAGCTNQACAYRDTSALLEQENVQVVGVSADPVNSLKYFRDQYGLNFPLLSDVNGCIARRFGVSINDGGSIKRTIQGREITLERPFTFARWTFIVDPSGKVIYKDTGVNVGEDAKNVADFLKSQGLK
jgi:peroxiredoxin Q/BCP